MQKKKYPQYFLFLQNHQVVVHNHPFQILNQIVIH